MTRNAVQVKRLRDPDAFLDHLAGLGISLPFTPEPVAAPESPLALALTVVDGVAGPLVAGNRFCVLPMEGWDGTPDGRPTELVERRWRRFGASGAKLVWGGEAVAVRPDGRANPHQLTIDGERVDGLRSLREALVDEHLSAFGAADDLVVGLQLTHSGRFARPEGTPTPVVAYRHPVLDPRLPEPHLLSDDELDELVEAFVVAAGHAHAAGFAFVDVKACHGYLGHELLSASDRPGRYGGDLAGRTRFLRSVIEGIRDRVPGLAVGVRLSAFDVVPYRSGADGTGEADLAAGAHGYPYAFGGDGTGEGIDLTEPNTLVRMLAELGVGMVCMSAGSPYYCPHVQRPAFFPPSDGYLPPRDPLIEVARLLDVTAALSAAHPDVAFVASGLTYLQEWVPHVADALVAAGGAGAVGLGRMVLSYPGLPADVLAGRPLDRRLLCRTFSDCTTAPRHGLVSGCYPLDDFYKARPERVELAGIKRSAARTARMPSP